MNWGKSIVLSFVLFASFIGVLVFVCVRQDVSLVSKDYYKDELDYQTQLERQHNTASLPEKPWIKILNGHTLEVHLVHFSNLEEGQLTLYSPSDVGADRKFSLVGLQEPDQVFDLKNMKKGMYRAKMTWSAKGKEFYFEQTIYL